MEIRKVKPTILSMGCHAQKGKGFELFRQIVDPHAMQDAIRSWNKSAREQSPPRPQIRIIVSNACDSEDHARLLSEVVDFAIGHDDPVEDQDAIDFSGIFFDCLFGCDSLMDSFNQAKSCSTTSRRTARRWIVLLMHRGHLPSCLLALTMEIRPTPILISKENLKRLSKRTESQISRNMDRVA